MPRPHYPERRRSDRFSPKGAVVLHTGEGSCQCRIVNVGQGGILMSAPATSWELSPGSAVEIELRLDGKRSQWLRLSGRVLRVDGGTIAMAFDSVPDAFSELVSETANSSHSHRRTLSVISVDASSGRRDVIAEAFRAAGCAVVEVSTPLDAVVQLGELEFEPDLVAIADSVPSSTSDELRRFVAREHPRAKLVTVGDGVTDPASARHWLSSMNPDDDLVVRVRRLLIRSQ